MRNATCVDTNVKGSDSCGPTVYYFLYCAQGYDGRGGGGQWAAFSIQPSECWAPILTTRKSVNWIIHHFKWIILIL